MGYISYNTYSLHIYLPIWQTFRCIFHLYRYHQHSLRYHIVKGTQVQSWRFGVLILMLMKGCLCCTTHWNMLNHHLVSVQLKRLLFHKVWKKLKIKFTIRIVNSQAKPFDGINSRLSMVCKKWNIIRGNNHSVCILWNVLIYKTVMIGLVPL